MPPATPLVVNHAGYEDPGFIGDWLRERGIAWTFISREHLAAGTSQRLGESASAVISLGSLWSPLDDSNPAIRNELNLLAECHVRGVPVLGVCFGGQLVARVLGGSVFPLKDPQVGFLPVRFNVLGTDDIISTSQFFWNHLAFSSPAHADVLATAGPGVAGFRIDRSFAVQFHLDATPRLLARWTDEGRDELDSLGIEAEAVITTARRNHAQTMQIVDLILSSMLDIT